MAHGVSGSRQHKQIASRAGIFKRPNQESSSVSRRGVLNGGPPRKAGFPFGLPKQPQNGEPKAKGEPIFDLQLVWPKQNAEFYLCGPNKLLSFTCVAQTKC